MNTRGRKILDIEWSRQGTSIKVPVKAFEKYDYEHTSETKDSRIMTFRATHKEAGIDVENTDINKVRNAVLEALDAWYSVKWKLYFLVTIGGGRTGQEGLKFDVDFEMEFYVLGKDCTGKDRRMRIPRPKPEQIANFDSKNFTRWGLEESSEGTPVVGKIKGHYGEEKTRALVKATTENVEAADRFMLSMNALLEKMHHHFAPERIERLLANVGNLLPAPKEKA